MDDKQASIKRLEEKHNLYKRFFDCNDGQEVLADLKRDCYYEGSTYASEALAMAYREGMRNVILHILTMIDLDTNQMKKMTELDQEVKPYRDQEM